ncbi:MAG: VWA domain-containing protein, partial [Planctomycetales bacterium]|nr:VWA domain-containing protein [Planctomycetales bacterium]
MNANDPKLTAYVLGELDDGDRAAVEAAVAESPTLQAELNAIRETAANLRSHFDAEPFITADEKVGVLAFAADSRYPRTRLVHRAATLAVSCALLLVVAALGWSTWSGDSSGNRPTVAKVLDPTPNSPSSSTPHAVDALEMSELEVLEVGGMELQRLPEEARPHDLAPFALRSETSAPIEQLETVTEVADQMYELRAARRTADFSSSGNADFFRSGLGGDGEAPSEREFSRYASGLESTYSPYSGAMPRFGQANAANPAASTERTDSTVLSATPRIIIPDETEPALVQDAEDADRRIVNREMEARQNLAAVTSESPQAPGLTRASDERGRAELDAKDGVQQDAARTSSATKAEPAKPARTTWRRASATPNNSRLLVGDNDELPLEGIQANVVIDGFRARVLLDCYYFNDYDRQLEGSFQIRLPNEASLYYFAFGQSSFEYRPQVDQLASRGFLSADLVRAAGLDPRDIREARQETWTNVKEARLVPPQKAAYAYSETVRRRVDPALVEWAGAGVFNAKVFPLMPQKLHRVVIGYDVNLEQTDGELVYRFDLPEDIRQRTVDLDIAALPGTSANVSPETRPFTSAGRAFYHYQNPAEAITVRLPLDEQTVLVGSDVDTGEFFATRIANPLASLADDQQSDSDSTHAMFLLDTSLSSNPDKFNVWLKLMEATLNENRSRMQQFAVLWFNVETHWWQPGYAENTPGNVARLIADCQQLSLEGATDLQAALAAAAQPVWQTTEGEPAATAPQPDLFLLSDGAATWGESSLARMQRTLERARVGSLFAYNTGLTGTDTTVLEQLANATGGAVFSVTSEDQITAAATAHRQRPWQLLTASVDGGSDLLIAGRPRSIFPGQSLLLVGRGLPTAIGDPAARLQLRRGDETREVVVKLTRTIESRLTPRMYGQVAVGQLESLADATETIATAYARHFRVTGRSVSLLMLESEADYERFDIRPEDDELVIQTTAAAEIVEQKLDEWASRLGDPKDLIVRWLAALEKAPGLSFTMPPALQPSFDRLSPRAFEVYIPPLDCQVRTGDELPAKYASLIRGAAGATTLAYEDVTREAD